jgi:hypothetical protein
MLAMSSSKNGSRADFITAFAFSHTGLGRNMAQGLVCSTRAERAKEFACRGQDVNQAAIEAGFAERVRSDRSTRGIEVSRAQNRELATSYNPRGPKRFSRPQQNH